MSTAEVIRQPVGDRRAEEANAEPGGPLPDYISGASLLAAGANEVLQQSIRGLGRGVVEAHKHEKTLDGDVFKHPFKRFRTTIAYIGIAAAGSDEERRAVRRDVGRSHAPVRSDERSPVTYSAFDHDLQLWVAACLYVGLVQVYELTYGPPSEDLAEQMYRDAARLGTTLQMPPDAWPATRADFDEYWSGMLERIELDDEVRGYLRRLMRLEMFGWPVSRTLGPAYEFLSIGFLPERFREELGADWSPGRQRVFDSVIAAVALSHRVMPRVVRQFPVNLALWDARRRLGQGRSFT